MGTPSKKLLQITDIGIPCGDSKFTLLQPILENRFSNFGYLAFDVPRESIQRYFQIACIAISNFIHGLFVV
jgi:hypothetical protein